MSSALLNRVLSCPNLPTLPGVAVKVLELTRDPEVSIGKIAQTVQNDPALSTKVLKTVNSSYYGLKTPCPSISRAMSLLGLNTVKSLVLGFSIVDCTRGVSGAIDLEQYWRRAVYSSAGARAIAIATRSCDPDEAFLGALLQDIGVLASWVALKDEYLRVIMMCPDDHDEVLVPEQDQLGFDHTQAGAQLAAKWRLPPQLVECISHHHTPDGCAPQHGNLLRCVHLGGLAAGALTLDDPKRKLGAFIVRAREWFKMESAASRELLPGISQGASEISKLLEVTTGQSPDVTQILSQAHELLAATQEQMQQESARLQMKNEELAKQTVTDALTGIHNRKFFDLELNALFDRCALEHLPMAVCFADGDRFKSVNDVHGHKAGDRVLVELARRLRESLGDAGTVCRYGGEEFVILLPETDLARAKEIAEQLRAAVHSSPIDLDGTGASVSALEVTVSIGVAATRPSQESTTAELLVQQADQSVYRAKKTGRNKVVAWGEFDPSEAEAEAPAPAPSTRSVLLVDDDPLAIRLLQFLLTKHAELQIQTAGSGEEAVQILSKGGTLPGLILVDAKMPGMSGLQLTKWIKSTPATSAIPVVMLSGVTHEAVRAGALAAGAMMFLDKAGFCADPEKWIGTMLEAAAKSMAA